MLIDVPEELGEKLLKENQKVKKFDNFELYNLISDKYFIEKLNEFRIVSEGTYNSISPEEYNYCLSKTGNIWKEISFEIYCITIDLILNYIDKFNDF